MESREAQNWLHVFVCKDAESRIIQSCIAFILFVNYLSICEAINYEDRKVEIKERNARNKKQNIYNPENNMKACK